MNRTKATVRYNVCASCIHIIYQTDVRESEGKKSIYRGNFRGIHIKRGKKMRKNHEIIETIFSRTVHCRHADMPLIIHRTPRTYPVRMGFTWTLTAMRRKKNEIYFTLIRHFILWPRTRLRLDRARTCGENKSENKRGEEQTIIRYFEGAKLDDASSPRNKNKDKRLGRGESVIEGRA